MFLCEDLIYNICLFIPPNTDFSELFVCERIKEKERNRYRLHTMNRGVEFIKRHFFPFMNVHFVYGKLTKLKINQIFTILNYRFVYDPDNIEDKPQYYTLKEYMRQFKLIELNESEFLNYHNNNKIYIDTEVDICFYKRHSVHLVKNKYMCSGHYFITSKDFRNVYVLI